MESIERKFKKLVDEGEVETARMMIRSQFEELMRKIKAEGLAGKEGYVFVCMGRNEEEKDFKPLVEFDTADDARTWYDSDGRAIIEDGGEIKIHYGPSELHNP